MLGAGLQGLSCFTWVSENCVVTCQPLIGRILKILTGKNLIVLMFRKGMKYMQHIRATYYVPASEAPTMCQPLKHLLCASL